MAGEGEVTFAATGEGEILSVWDRIAKAAGVVYGVWNKTADAVKEVAGKDVTVDLKQFGADEQKKGESPTSFAADFGKGLQVPFTLAIGYAKTLGGTMESLGGGMKKAADAATGAWDSFESFADRVKGVVGKFAPGAADAIGQKQDDLMATIGAKLMPVVSPLLGVFDAVGEALSAIDISSLTDALAPVLQQVGEAFRTVVDAAGPAIELLAGALGEALEALSPVIGEAAEVVAQLVEALTPAIQILTDGLLEVIKDLVPPVTDMVKALGKMVKALEPVISLIAKGLVYALKAIEPIIIGIAKIVEWLAEKVEAVTKNPGVAAAAFFGAGAAAALSASQSGAEEEKKARRDSKGKGHETAVRGVSFGSIEDASRRASEAAGRAGYAQRTANASEAMARTAQAILDTMGRISQGQNPADAMMEAARRLFNPQQGDA